MKYWTRTTHNFNNSTREWEFRTDLKERKWKERSLLGIHALYSGQWTCLWQIVDENKSYYDTYYNHPYMTVESDGFSESAILYDLEMLEKDGLVKSKVLP